MSELVLTDNENGLFELMRDGVITNLTEIHVGPSTYRCTTNTVCEGVTHFESKISALEAFMQARTHIITLKLEGRDVYRFSKRTKRKELGLA